jgi:hypothetical protein
MTRFQISGSYRPVAPRTVAMWAVVCKFGEFGRDYTIKALREAGLEKIGFWIGDAEWYVNWLVHRGYVHWEES